MPDFTVSIDLELSEPLTDAQEVALLERYEVLGGQDNDRVSTTFVATADSMDQALSEGLAWILSVVDGTAVWCEVMTIAEDDRRTALLTPPPRAL